MASQVLQDRMRVAILEIETAKASILQAAIELKSQDFLDEADDLETLLEDLKTQQIAIIAAVSAA